MSLYFPFSFVSDYFSENLEEFFLVTYIPMTLHIIFTPLFLLRSKSFSE